VNLNQLSPLAIGGGIVCIGALALLILNISMSSPERAGQQNVTIYAGDGSAIKTWSAVNDADADYDNSRVVFTDPSTKEKVILRGTVVIDDGEFQWDRPVAATHVVSLYAFTKEPIRRWEAADVDPRWTNERTVFIDMKTGHRVTIHGTVIIEKLTPTKP
jgi:hypothetical protein